MQKTYSHNESRYKSHIIYTGYFIIAFGIFCIIKLIMKPELNLYVFALVAAIYGTLNTFVFKSNPKDVIIDDETITFASPFGSHQYKIAELTEFVVKESANESFYIRVRQKDGKHGRYWVQYYYFSDKDDLIKDIYYIENKIHPQNVKFRGRENMFRYRPGQAPAEKSYTEDDFMR